MRALRPKATYRFTRFDPVTGQHARIDDVRTDAQGEWRPNSKQTSDCFAGGAERTFSPDKW